MKTNIPLTIGSLLTIAFAANLLRAGAAENSGFARQEAAAGSKFKPPQELKQDDGASVGKRSMAGSGHAVEFQAPSKNSYLTAVRLFGSRYGSPAPPAENAYVWLCDSDFKLIAAFPVAYANFQRGEAQWVNLGVKPTLVPEKFIIAVGFNPTATKGVYIHYDAAGSGHSFLGLPGGERRPLENGDWLIRAVVQEPEAAASR